MPTFRFRKHLLDRVLSEVRTAGELGLAFLMTAGVASCGGTTTSGLDGGPEASQDGSGVDHPGIEAAQDAGHPEAAQEASVDSGTDGAAVEAAQEAGGHDGPFVEAVSDGGHKDAHVPPVEAATMDH